MNSFEAIEFENVKIVSIDFLKKYFIKVQIYHF
jgi:hypothetical protein